jgi:transcription elongation regulator 1
LSQVKVKIQKDPRYDAVGSSSLREELYDTYMKAKEDTSDAYSKKTEIVNGSPSEKLSREERRELAVRQREAQVQAEKRKVEADIDRSKIGLNREEDEASFRCAKVHILNTGLALIEMAFNSQLSVNRCHSRSSGTPQLGERASTYILCRRHGMPLSRSSRPIHASLMLLFLSTNKYSYSRSMWDNYGLNT